MKLTKNDSTGFTIIEIMIVMVIAAVILMTVFFAIPALQRHARNAQRDADAALLVTAIDNCLANNNNSGAACSNPANIPLSKSDFGIFTGFHYGASAYGVNNPRGPTPDEPNWLFALRCTDNNNWITTNDYHTFVVTYLKEDGSPPKADGSGGYVSRCLDG